MTEREREFVVGVTGDGANPDGSTLFGDIHLEELTRAGLRWFVLPDPHDEGVGEATMQAALEQVDAVLSTGHLPFDGAIVRRLPRLVHLARFGAGYDGIDVDELTAEGVLVTTTPTAVRTPVALSAVTLVLALAHELLANHAAVAAGRFVEERGTHRGAGLDGRQVGVIGFGSIGAEVARMLQALGARVVATNRSGRSEAADALGVPLVPLQELAATSDYLVVTASLNPGSHHLVDETVIAAMKPGAFIVNVGRGPIIDQAALTKALQEGRIAGAGLDVFDPEPPDPHDPLLALPNVVLSPHALCWTADFTREVSAQVRGALIDTAAGRQTPTALNPEVYAGRWRGDARFGPADTATRPSAIDTDRDLGDR